MPALPPHLTLIDGSGMIQRAWAMGGSQANAQGEEVGAARLFSRMLMKLARQMSGGAIPPTAIAVLFDPPREGTWRRALSPAYKAHRPDPDPAYVSQVLIIREMCEALGIAQGLCASHEADDMIAAYALDGAAAGMKVSVVSADKDLLQLVRPGIRQVNPMTQTWFNAAAVEAKFGVGPDLLGDLLALTGDSGDGVKGAPGIGPKGAAALLREFGNLEELLTRAQHITKPAARKSIEENADQIRLARRLVSLDSEGCARPFALDAARMPGLREMGARLDEWARDRLDGGRAEGPSGP